MKKIMRHIDNRCPNTGTGPDFARGAGAKKKGRGDPSILAPRKKIPATFYSPTRYPRSTLDAEALHCRVRNGNGCYLLAMATGKRWFRPKPEEECRKSWGEAQRMPGGAMRACNGRYDQASRLISTGRLNASPRLYLRPIEVVVCNLP